MSLDALSQLSASDEARRQLEICNACRYCEGYCSVFPAMTLRRAFTDGDVTQLANLCHNCRGCYYACQYTEPHEFRLNLPRALAEVRSESWERFIRPHGVARLFQTSGAALAGALFLAILAMIAAALALSPESGTGFYAHLSHAVMLAVFLPASALPVVVVAFGVHDYWRAVGGRRPTIAEIGAALTEAARLRDLSGGAAEGCNYEQGDRFTMARRWAHQAVMWGFCLCFAATVSGTMMHYVFAMPAPYGLLSLPKLLGVPGGVLMTIGGMGLITLKLRAEKTLGAPAAWTGEMAFVVLLTTVAVTGLLLFGASGTAAARPLLILHLASVLTFFLSAPYTKMAHVPFRVAALLRDRQERAPQPGGA